MQTVSDNHDYLTTAYYLASRYPNYGLAKEWYQWLWMYDITRDDIYHADSGLEIVHAFQRCENLPSKHFTRKLPNVTELLNRGYTW